MLGQERSAPVPVSGNAPAPTVARPGGAVASGWVLPAALLAASVAAWLVAAPSLSTDTIDNRGLLFGASPLFAVSLVLCALAFLVAVGGRRHGLAALALGVSVVLTRLPTAVAVSLPLYSWTYKHFGVIDYVSTYGHLDHGVDIYHSWPGMFTLFAWVNELTGTNSFQLALWFTPIYQLALTAAIYVMARAWRLGRGPALVAAFIAHTANWVAQDYFSPQAVAMLLAVGVLALLAHSGKGRRAIGTPHPAAVWVALPIYAGVVVSHQLTPFWLMIVIGAGCVFGQIRPRWVMVVFAATVIGWTALNYDVVSSYGSIFHFDPMGNVARNVNGGNPSDGQRLTSLAGRFTTISTWLVTGVVLLLRWRRREQRRLTLTLAALALGSFTVLLGQSYGGEAIFRVFLYSIPGCALVIAPAVERWLTGRARWGRTGRLAAVVSLLLLTGAAAQAFYGAWFANRVDQDALEASVWIVEKAPADAMVLALAPGAPGRVVARYTEFVRNNRDFDGGVDAWDGWLGTDFKDGRVNEMTDAMLGDNHPTYAVITAQMKVYNAYYGLFPPGAIERFENQLLANPHWHTLVHTPSLTVLVINQAAA